jgi:hypothetical protein
MTEETSEKLEVVPRSCPNIEIKRNEKCFSRKELYYLMLKAQRNKKE